MPPVASFTPSVCICHFLLPELVSANPAGQGHTGQCCHVLFNYSFLKSSSLRSSVKNSRPRFPQRPTKQERQVHVSGSSFGQRLQLPTSPLGPRPSCAFGAALGPHCIHTNCKQDFTFRLCLIVFLHCWAEGRQGGWPCIDLCILHVEPRLVPCLSTWYHFPLRV